MKSKTALQILLDVLGDESPSSDAVQIKQALQEHLNRQRSHRHKEVISYLLAASDGGNLSKTSSGNSLKHVLWWLRDAAGELYEPAAREAITMALEGRWPLANALEHLHDGKIIPLFGKAIATGESGQQLTKKLEIRKVGRWRVAINVTMINLTAVAFRQSRADIYVAVSGSGAVIMGRRGLIIDGRVFPEWKQTYPNQLLWVVDDPPPLIDDIIGKLPEAVANA